MVFVLFDSSNSDWRDSALEVAPSRVISVYVHLSIFSRVSSLALRLEIDLFFGRPSLSLVETREGPFPSSSLIDKRWERCMLLLSLIDFLTKLSSTDAVANLLLEFW